MTPFNLKHPDIVSKARYIVAADVFYVAESDLILNDISFIHLDDPSYVDVDFAIPPGFSAASRRQMFEELPEKYRIGYPSVVPLWTNASPDVVEDILDSAAERVRKGATRTPHASDDLYTIDLDG